MATVSISMSEERLKQLDALVEVQRKELARLGIAAEVSRSSVVAKLVEDRYEERK